MYFRLSNIHIKILHQTNPWMNLQIHPKTNSPKHTGFMSPGPSPHTSTCPYNYCLWDVYLQYLIWGSNNKLSPSISLFLPLSNNIYNISAWHVTTQRVATFPAFLNGCVASDTLTEEIGAEMISAAYRSSPGSQHRLPCTFLVPFLISLVKWRWCGQCWKSQVESSVTEQIKLPPD